MAVCPECEYINRILKPNLVDGDLYFTCSNCGLVLAVRKGVMDSEESKSI